MKNKVAIRRLSQHPSICFVFNLKLNGTVFISLKTVWGQRGGGPLSSVADRHSEVGFYVGQGTPA